MSIVLKNFKSTESMSEETLYFSATIYHNGKYVGTVANEGHGGACYIFIADPEDRHALNAEAALLGEDIYRPVPGADGATLTEHLSSVLLSIAEEMHEKKQLKTWCRTKILFRIDGEPYRAGEYNVIKRKYTPEEAQKIRLHYMLKSKTVTFLNETIGR